MSDLGAKLAVETIDLTKTYGSTTVVDRLNLHVEEGDIFGFLGPNGAGKTTIILMLLGLTEPTSGVARIFGYNSTREPIKVKSISGYVPEKVGFYEDLTAGYNLSYTARLSGLSEELITKKVGESLELVGLPGMAGRKVREFSKGMKQRLAIADVLIRMPKVAFLDEPTSGIDPEGIKQLLALIARIAKEQGVTIVISSHQLSQVQQICNRVGILAKGKVVAEGSLDQLGREAFGGGQFRVEVQLTEITSALVDSIRQIDGVVDVTRSGELLIVNCLRDVRPQIAKTVVDNNGLLVQMKIESYALEDIYMKYSSEA